MNTRFSLSAALFAVLTAIVALAQTSTQPAQEKPQAPPALQDLIVPDGTPVEMRFAQPVWGPAARKRTFFPPKDIEAIMGVVDEARPGDSVRLVVAANVRVDGRTVIAKGATGEATVTDVEPPERYGNDDTKLSLRLDWVKSVTDAEIPLRISKTGTPGHFHVHVLTAPGGFVARPQTFTTSLAFHKKNWIPAGTRITGYVHGAVHLNGPALDAIQTPAADSAATLTIYRTKDSDQNRPTVSCDGKAVAQIGRQQYAVLELPPGEHSCQAEDEKPLVIRTLPGDELYVRLQRRSSSGGWELKPVTTSEGEDAVTANMTPQ